MREATGVLRRARETGVSRRGDIQAAGGVVVSRAARAGAALTPRLVCCLSVREGVGVGKGGAASRGDRAAGRALVRAPLVQRAALTVEAINRPVTARGEPTGPAPPASSPGLRGGAARGGSLGRGLGGVGEVGALGRVARWVARPGAEMGRAWAGEGADAAPGLPRKV